VQISLCLRVKVDAPSVPTPDGCRLSAQLEMPDGTPVLSWPGMDLLPGMSWVVGCVNVNVAVAGGGTPPPLPGPGPGPGPNPDPNPPPLPSPSSRPNAASLK
jgi:hypothetical protein